MAGLPVKGVYAIHQRRVLPAQQQPEAAEQFGRFR